MATKKSIWILFGTLVISVWIPGFSTPALSESIKCKSEAKGDAVRVQEQADSSYFIGIVKKEGSVTCENGETGDVKSYSLIEVNWPKECVVQTITIYIFNKDWAKIITKGDIVQIQDPKGEAEWIWEGTGEIIKGTGRFSGIKGGTSFKGKQLPPDKKSISEFTINYTLPPK